MRKTITVAEKKIVHSGNTNGHQWFLTEIIDTEGVKQSTFNGGLYEVGQTYEVEVEKKVNEKNGKVYENWQLQDNPKKGDAPRTQGSTKLPATSSPLEKKIDEILELVKQIHEKQAKQG